MSLRPISPLRDVEQTKWQILDLIWKASEETIEPVVLFQFGARDAWVRALLYLAKPPKWIEIDDTIRLEDADEVEVQMTELGISEYQRRRPFQVIDQKTDQTEPPQVRFPTPKGATWEDVRIQFLDGHTVAIRVKNQSGTATFELMGMQDRRTGRKDQDVRPDTSWELLQDLADEGGVITWGSGKASSKIRSRKRSLGKKLRHYFGLSDDPIKHKTVESDGTNGYKARFLVFPERPDQPR